MGELKMFENGLFKVSAKLKDGQVLFEVEQVARSLGFTQTKNNKEYIRWETVNGYLDKYVSHLVGKGDFIPEPLVYKLAFKAKNETAENFQDWLAVEVIPSIRKTGGYEIEQPKSIEDLIIMQAESVKEVKERLDTVETKQDHITEIVSLNNNNWRKEVNKIINTIAKNNGGSYKQTRQESYSRLENRARCDLERRLLNKRERMRKEGQSKKALETTNKLSVIADDARLTEIYLAVVKEMAISYEGGFIQ